MKNTLKLLFRSCGVGNRVNFCELIPLISPLPVLPLRRWGSCDFVMVIACLDRTVLNESS